MVNKKRELCFHKKRKTEHKSKKDGIYVWPKITYKVKVSLETPKKDKTGKLNKTHAYTGENSVSSDRNEKIEKKGVLQEAC